MAQSYCISFIGRKADYSSTSWILIPRPYTHYSGLICMFQSPEAEHKKVDLWGHTEGASLKKHHLKKYSHVTNTNSCISHFHHKISHVSEENVLCYQIWTKTEGLLGGGGGWRGQTSGMNEQTLLCDRNSNSA